VLLSVHILLQSSWYYWILIFISFVHYFVLADDGSWSSYLISTTYLRDDGCWHLTFVYCFVLADDGLWRAMEMMSLLMTVLFFTWEMDATYYPYLFLLCCYFSSSVTNYMNLATWDDGWCLFIFMNYMCCLLIFSFAIWSWKHSSARLPDDVVQPGLLYDSRKYMFMGKVYWFCSSGNDATVSLYNVFWSMLIQEHVVACVL
jgi:hypothetical protein